ncbi:MAG: gliding motility-associated C-terminal domain-containing protein [Bacteroidota bacterium]
MNKPGLWTALLVIFFLGACEKDEAPQCNTSRPEVIGVTLPTTDFFCLYNDQTAVLQTVVDSLVKYDWNTGDTTSAITIDQGGQYSVVIRDTAGDSLDLYRIQIYDCDPTGVVAIPNTFTPNGYGLNDFWKPFGDICGRDLTVRNLDGQLVFQTQQDEAWDGRHRETGLFVPQGTYFYTFDAVFFDQSRETYTGEVLVSN